MTHIYYNPKTNLLSTTPKEGYTAFVNATDVAREKEETREHNAAMEGTMNALVRDNLRLKITAELYDGIDDITPVLLGGWVAIIYGMFDTTSIRNYIIVAGFIILLLYVFIKIRYYMRARRKYEAVENMYVGRIEVIKKERINTSGDHENSGENETENNNINLGGGGALGLC